MRASTGAGTLQVSLGAGSAAPADQIAFSATVASPYASTTFVVWDIHANGGAAQNQGACVLWSSLLGAGARDDRARSRRRDRTAALLPQLVGSGPGHARSSRASAWPVSRGHRGKPRVRALILTP